MQKSLSSTGLLQRGKGAARLARHPARAAWTYPRSDRATQAGTAALRSRGTAAPADEL